MSLHVGRIPSHIRQDELERVFRRFGRCKLELKDGYGFAVFEVGADAEKALNALRGKTICGRQLTLHWSNIQPRPLQRSARPTKIYEHRRKNFRKNDNRVRTRHPDRGADYVPKDIDDIGEEGDVTNAMENDRCGEPISDKIAGNEMGNDTDFDRYEPYHGYEREDKKEDNQIASRSGSPCYVSPREAKKNFDISKLQPTCYNCGLAGHIKRYCPEGDAKREKFSKFGHRRDEINFRGRNDGKRKMPRISRVPMISRCNGMDRKESHFGNPRKLARREKNRPKLEVDSREKKRGEKEREIQRKMPEKRRSRRFGTSSLSSSSSTNSSRTHSGSSHLPSGSECSKSPSASSSSMSASISSYVKSKSRRSGSQSRSSVHRSPSLSVSLDKKSPSSPSYPNDVIPNISGSSYKENYSNMNLANDVAVVSETDREGNSSKETLTLQPNEHITMVLREEISLKLLSRNDFGSETLWAASS